MSDERGAIVFAIAVLIGIAVWCLEYDLSHEEDKDKK